ncbi:hypothetical protein ZWY2020_011693 [Hordeum vulgare]|nr:hypothetical protein ZWY2020_011693 [Hordeum vulgare]
MMEGAAQHLTEGFVGSRALRSGVASGAGSEAGGPHGNEEGENGETRAALHWGDASSNGSEEGDGQRAAHMQIIIMEEWLTFSLIALSTLLSLGLFKLSGGKKQALPPGPWRLPIIGSLHHVVSILPHRTMTELCRRHGPMMYLQLGEIPTVVLSSKEAVGQMMKASDLQFTKRRITAMQDIVGFGGKGITFAPYGDHWRQMRKVCVTELLSSKQVRRMESVRAEEMGSLLRSMTASAGATVNFSQKVAALSNDVVARAVFGGKFSQQEDFIHASDRIMDLLGGFFLVDLFPSSRLVRWLSSEERRIQSSRDLMHRIITDVIDERKAVRAASNGGTCDEGLLDVLLTRQEEDSLESPLTTDMITTVLFDMFGAGTDTTSTTLEWAMSELVNHGEAMAKAQLEQLLMADPVTAAAAIGWGLKAVGWVASPAISDLFKKCSCFLGFNASEKLRKLEPKILLLERVMEMVAESPHRVRLQQLFEDLKSAFYEAEDIWDDVEYHRLEKQVQNYELNSDGPPSTMDLLKQKVQSLAVSPLTNKLFYVESRVA